MEHDPTHFSLVSHRYQEVVLSLLSCEVDDLPSSIDQQTLVAFRKTHGESEITCRFHDCPFHSDGFETVQKRNDHELSHVKTLRCDVPTCECFARGFASKSGLLKHNRKYHPSPHEGNLPEFVPVRHPTPPPAPAVPPVPNVPIPPPRNQPPSGVRELPELQTLKKVRQKRGKRGLPVHECELCRKVFMRAEALRYTSLRPWMSCVKTYSEYNPDATSSATNPLASVARTKIVGEDSTGKICTNGICSQNSRLPPTGLIRTAILIRAKTVPKAVPKAFPKAVPKSNDSWQEV